MKSEVLVKSPGFAVCRGQGVHQRLLGVWPEGRVMRGLAELAAVDVSISSPILVSDELSPHLMGNPGWKEEVGCCQG